MIKRCAVLTEERIAKFNGKDSNSRPVENTNILEMQQRNVHNLNLILLRFSTLKEEALLYRKCNFESHQRDYLCVFQEFYYL